MFFFVDGGTALAVFAIAGLLSSVLSGYVAAGKRREVALWALVGFMLPVLSFVIVLALPPGPAPWSRSPGPSTRPQRFKAPRFPARRR